MDDVGSQVLQLIVMDEDVVGGGKVMGVAQMPLKEVRRRGCVLCMRLLCVCLRVCARQAQVHNSVCAVVKQGQHDLQVGLAQLLHTGCCAPLSQASGRTTLCLRPRAAPHSAAGRALF